MSFAVLLQFAPGDYVRITFLGVNYKGRVNRVFVDGERDRDILYETQFAKDNGDLTMLTFRYDELEAWTDPPPVGFAADR